jgi:hypothetical protein
MVTEDMDSKFSIEQIPPRIYYAPFYELLPLSLMELPQILSFSVYRHEASFPRIQFNPIKY